MAVSVLVVDDSAIARKMLIRALPADWDATILQAASGAEALAAYRTGTVDVMFLDLTMPDMDGYAVLEVLRQEGMNCLVIVVSADIQPQAKQRVKDAGAIAFIQKPVSGEGLSEILKAHGVAL